MHLKNIQNKKYMIPKIIHYCWLSDEPIPQNLQKYIEGWKKLMPDYQFKKWDKKAFDIHSVKWVEDAYNNRKWAFAADYIRAYALYTEGGFYLDSDVLMQQRLDKYLNAGFVSSVEYNPSCRDEIIRNTDENGIRKKQIPYFGGLGIQAAIIGSEKRHVFPKELLDYYHTHSFINEDNTFNQLPAPVIYGLLLEKYGFRYKDVNQKLDHDIMIYNSSVFAGFQTCTFFSVGIHMCAGSWVEKKSENSVMAKIKKNLFVRKILNPLVKLIQSIHDSKRTI